MTSDIIKKEIWMNAKNWKQETLSSLKTHYDRVIKEQLNNFYNLPDHEWRHPFKVAVKWAKTNLGQRLQQHTITQTEKLLADGLKKAELSMLRSGQVQTSIDPAAAIYVTLAFQSVKGGINAIMSNLCPLMRTRLKAWTEVRLLQTGCWED